MTDFRDKSFGMLRSELMSGLSDLAVRRQEANAVWDEQEKEIRHRLEVLDRMEREFTTMFGTSNDPPAQDVKGAESQAHSASIQARLRIGDQRYRMLHAVRSSGDPVAEETVSQATGYPIRRVKEQLQADARLGVVSAIDGKYFLTPEGRSLMEQFEESRRSKGQRLPVVNEAAGDAAHDPATSEQGENLV